MNVQDDKYDQAVAFLRDQDAVQGGGSYFEEVAGMIEELVGRVFELEEAAASKKARAPATEFITLPDGRQIPKPRGVNGNQRRT